MNAIPATTLEPLTLPESNRLIELERKIELGLQTFVEVGEALLEIRDSRLYKIEHSTFEEYCREKWSMSDRQARHLISASSVTTNLSKTGTIVPKVESQARPLAKLPPEQQAPAWETAVEKADGKQPTAKQVEEAVLEIVGDQKPTRIPKVIIDTADHIWAVAKSHLDKITKGDVSREKVLREMIAYGEKRLAGESK